MSKKIWKVARDTSEKVWYSDTKEEAKESLREFRKACVKHVQHRSLVEIVDKMIGKVDAVYEWANASTSGEYGIQHGLVKALDRLADQLEQWSIEDKAKEVSQ